MTTLKVFAEALGPLFTYDAALTRLVHASDLAPLYDQVFLGDHCGRPDLMAACGGRPIGNWAEWLAVLGFASRFPDHQIDWSMRTILARCAAWSSPITPCAMLSARA